MWVTVAYAYHGMAAVKVEILLSAVVPHAAALTFDDVYVE
jgi:hypothetical protein